MEPRVIVEGPDGSGKTRLLDHLVKDTGLTRRERACTSEDGPIDNIKGYVEDYLRDHTGGIWDRHPLISEPIYGPIIRGYMSGGFDNPAWLSPMLAQFYAYEPIIIYCLPAWYEVHNNILKNHDARTPHMAGVVEKGLAIYNLYQAQASRDAIRPGVFIYDYGYPVNYREIKNLILDRKALGNV